MLYVGIVYIHKYALSLVINNFESNYSSQNNYFFVAAFTVFAAIFFGLGVLIFTAGAFTAFLALNSDLDSR